MTLFTPPNKIIKSQELNQILIKYFLELNGSKGPVNRQISSGQESNSSKFNYIHSNLENLN